MNLFNFSLDDFCPHPDAGLFFESISLCDKLIEQFPEFKVNLFIPAAFARINENPVFLMSHGDWVKRVSSLSPNNYRINFHGVFHRRLSEKFGNSNNDEFQYLDKNQTEVLISVMMNEFSRAGLKNSVKTFRPPGWKLSVYAAEALTKNGFIIAGNPKHEEVIRWHVRNMRWVNFNHDLADDYEKIKIVYPNVVKAIYGHTSNWTNNYFDKHKYEMMLSLLSEHKYKFEFIENLVGKVFLDK